MAEKLLKSSVDTILSIDTQMFPLLSAGIRSTVIRALDEVYGKHGLEVNHEFNADVIDAIATLSNNWRSCLLLFTSGEIGTIKDKVAEYKSDPHSRSGGGFLLKILQDIERIKAQLSTATSAIAEALKPKEVTRTTLAQAQEQQLAASIKAVAFTLKGLNTKVLRDMAKALFGSDEENYMNEELAMALAHKQLTGISLEPGKVLV